MLRFNRRWLQFLDRLNLEPANFVIDQYNRYYVLEKECVMGSAATRRPPFHPRAPLTTPDRSWTIIPLLPVPELARSSRAGSIAAEPII